MDVRQIRRYEASEQQPLLSVAVAIADALKISVGELAGKPSHRIKLSGHWWASWQRDLTIWLLNVNVPISKVFWWDLMKRLVEFPPDQGGRVGQAGVVLACARLASVRLGCWDPDFGRRPPGPGREPAATPTTRPRGRNHDGICR